MLQRVVDDTTISELAMSIVKGLSRHVLAAYKECRARQLGLGCMEGGQSEGIFVVRRRRLLGTGQGIIRQIAVHLTAVRRGKPCSNR